MGAPSHGAGSGFGAVVLAGGRSSRMGTPKALLEWHGSTLLRHVAGILGRATGGPVVVVRAAGQELPALPDGVVVIDDVVEGRGPLDAVAAGLRALDECRAVYVSATDCPFLHPDFVTAILRSLDDAHDAVLPIAHGHPHPLAAAYRPALAAALEAFSREGGQSPGAFLERTRTLQLDEIALRSMAAVAATDPGLRSLQGLNELDAYAAARSEAPPTVTLRAAASPVVGMTVAAATVAEAAAVSGVEVTPAARVNGRPTGGDALYPLVTGDVVVL